MAVLANLQDLALLALLTRDQASIHAKTMLSVGVFKLSVFLM